MYNCFLVIEHLLMTGAIYSICWGFVHQTTLCLDLLSLRSVWWPQGESSWAPSFLLSAFFTVYFSIHQVNTTSTFFSATEPEWLLINIYWITDGFFWQFYPWQRMLTEKMCCGYWLFNVTGVSWVWYCPDVLLKHSFSFSHFHLIVLNVYAYQAQKLFGAKRHFSIDTLQDALLCSALVVNFHYLSYILEGY